MTKIKKIESFATKNRQNLEKIASKSFKFVLFYDILGLVYTNCSRPAKKGPKTTPKRPSKNTPEKTPLFRPPPNPKGPPNPGQTRQKGGGTKTGENLSSVFPRRFFEK